MGSYKTNVIYIASIGRSGTTLLDCILGAHSEISSIGELHLWPHEIREDGVLPCGSGKLIQEDPFWTTMRERVKPLLQPRPRIDYFREKHDAGKTLRLGNIREFYPISLPKNKTSNISTYGKNTKRVYETFLNLVEEEEGDRPSWVVDSSKDPYRLAWLARSSSFNLNVVHLVRKPKGFIHSVTKPFIYTDGYPFLRRLYWTVRQSGAWSIRNHLISMIAKNHLDPTNYEIVNYEVLATKPKQTVKKILNLTNLQFESNAVENFRDGSPYAIGGNPMRQRSGGIELDEMWKDNLPYSSRVVTDLLTSFNRSKFV